MYVSNGLLVLVWPPSVLILVFVLYIVVLVLVLVFSFVVLQLTSLVIGSRKFTTVG